MPAATARAPAAAKAAATEPTAMASAKTTAKTTGRITPARPAAKAAMRCPAGAAPAHEGMVKALAAPVPPAAIVPAPSHAVVIGHGVAIALIARIAFIAAGRAAIGCSAPKIRDNNSATIIAPEAPLKWRCRPAYSQAFSRVGSVSTG